MYRFEFSAYNTNWHQNAKLFGYEVLSPKCILNFSRQNALLATISEKDANIALLELSPTAGSDAEVRKFKAEKDKLVNELKEQVI